MAMMDPYRSRFNPPPALTGKLPAEPIFYHAGTPAAVMAVTHAIGGAVAKKAGRLKSGNKKEAPSAPHASLKEPDLKYNAD